MKQREDELDGPDQVHDGEIGEERSGGRLRHVTGRFSTLRTSWQSKEAPGSAPIHDDAATLDAGRPNDENEGLPEGQRGPVEKTSRRDLLQGLGHKTKSKTKQLLKLHDAKDGDGQEAREGDAAVGSIGSEPAFNPDKLEARGRAEGADNKTDKALGTLHSVANAVVHPREAVKGQATKTAGQVSKAEHPYLSQKADDELVEANDDLRRARRSSEADGADVADRKVTLDALEMRRESLKVAWTTGRHIRRVRAVPRRRIGFPHRADFVERDEKGEVVRFQWERWLGLTLIYYSQDFSSQYVDDFDAIPFDLDTLRHHIERLVMVSAPWQTWAMQVRRVYRWEDPRVTGQWLALFLVLWYTAHTVTFAYAYVIYMVVYNRMFPASIGRLQRSLERSSDRGLTATKVGELIDKHGRDDWVGPLVASLGPSIQLQLGDLANLLEVFANFYAWKSPRKTAASLFFVSSCLLMCVLADAKFCSKVFWFIVGGGFFVAWPVSSNYPKYRLLVSPFKWVLWDIPTDAEWSFQFLRRQAQVKREAMIGQRVRDAVERDATNRGYAGHMTIEGGGGESPSPNASEEDEDWYMVSSTEGILDDADVVALRCTCHGAAGRLVISAGHVRFVRSLPKKEMWRRSYQELEEMRKVRLSKVVEATTSLARLELRFVDGEIVRLGMGKERDEAFNTIIGFSGVQWQSLQGGPGADEDEAEAHKGGEDDGRDGK
ncbi:MAG: hypothetical protein M1832_002872 [Thelocarpon impressellum]|nr:MAG: hypothetical protein M1832_002872 [Thelocarpon impressellum]